MCVIYTICYTYHITDLDVNQLNQEQLKEAVSERKGATGFAVALKLQIILDAVLRIVRVISGVGSCVTFCLWVRLQPAVQREAAQCSSAVCASPCPLGYTWLPSVHAQWLPPFLSPGLIDLPWQLLCYSRKMESSSGSRRYGVLCFIYEGNTTCCCMTLMEPHPSPLSIVSVIGKVKNQWHLRTFRHRLLIVWLPTHSFRAIKVDIREMT